MRSLFLICVIFMSCSAAADPFAPPKSDQVEMSKKAPLGTLPHKKIDYGTPKNNAVPFPETFFTSPDAEKAYSEASEGAQNELSQYFESYKFADRMIPPAMQDISPSLEERKRRVAAALIKKMKEAKKAPKNPLGPADENDKTAASAMQKLKPKHENE